MAVLLNKMKDAYDFIFHELADERSRDLFPSGLFMIMLMPSYLYFSTVLGPAMMKDLKPFKLRRVIFYYNLFQIFISGYMFCLGIKGGWFNGYNFACQPIDYSDNPQTQYMRKAAWWYTFVKLIDLLDTIFFVLRKKDSQITFLHVFHHFAMPIASFTALKYFPNGHGTFVGLINCVVHVVMYTYYFIAGLGPKYQKYLWWKKHVTVLQLVQFVIIFFHNLVAYLDSTCEYPKWLHVVVIVHSLQFICMFGSFFIKTYINNSKKSNGTIKFSNGKLKTQ